MTLEGSIQMSSIFHSDSKKASTIYIYNATARSWSAQTMTTRHAFGGGPPFDPTNVGAVLDHDTNVFCMYKFFISA